MSLKCHSENPDSKIRLSTSQQKLELKYSNNFQNEEDPWYGSLHFFFPNRSQRDLFSKKKIYAIGFVFFEIFPSLPKTFQFMMNF